MGAPSSCSDLIDSLEYEVYVRWFDWLMEHKRPKVDLIGKHFSCVS